MKFYLQPILFLPDTACFDIKQLFCDWNNCVFVVSKIQFCMARKTDCGVAAMGVSITITHEGA